MIYDMRAIDLNEWEQTGSGAVGMSYFHKTDPTLMLKFMSEGTRIENIEKELNNSRNVYNLGIPTPNPGEMVTDGKRIGIMFERIKGKRSYAKMIGEEPQNIDALAKEFVAMAKLVHSTPCDTSKFKGIKEFSKEMINGNQFRSDALKEKALNYVFSMPDATTCLHGDLHMGNIIKAGDKSYMIDLLDFSYGHYLFDFGTLGSLIVVMKNMEPIFEREYHCTIAQGTQFWHSVLKEYFGPDTDVNRKIDELRPFIAIKTLCMEKESGIRIPDIAAKEVFSVFGE